MPADVEGNEEPEGVGRGSVTACSRVVPRFAASGSASRVLTFRKHLAICSRAGVSWCSTRKAKTRRRDAPERQTSLLGAGLVCWLGRERFV